ncbi:histidine kinase [Xylanimonas cellulosilytica DSM 15894]|uniref:histidine kinase n=1 Tax=Xylanimonas cellulosilytica (strain DSM 15894 / JCM 12276 / CECT 5975 / KCTC 9989 / LMG 20990 / NBRC 107835 / XIL07) TaxID=446471 RepID=D1BU46_XYLCX|nr:ATP-binding protein [Xylanimonas cellulosilytica]ACZ29210.1 histidine kinase [Xylanimonas cellulosilytica DSM 15894]
MLRRLGVRGKILATLAMPILVLALAAGWVSWDSLRTARTADQTAELVASLAAQDAAGSAVAAERSLNIAAAMGIPGAKESLEAAFEETGKALTARDEALAAVNTDALDVRVRRAISATRADLQQIGRLQEQILDGTIPETEATRQYNEYIENALAVAHELAGTTEDSTLSLHLDAYVAMDETMLAVVYERPIVGGVLAGAMTGQVDQGSVLRTVTTIDATNRQFEATKGKLDRLPGGHRLPPLDGALGTVRTALGQMDVAGLDPAAAGQWNQLTQDWVAESQPVRDGVRDGTAAYSQWLADEARISALTTAGGAFGILALSILIALSVARRIVRPLRRLTAATGEIRDRLPKMVEQMAVPGQASTVDLFEIPVESRDEIGRLAQSFNDVNATTVAVAKEQAALRGSIAEMFVNVARRDQVLLNRQLAFLDDLERSEEDPSTLSNLFRLDHLATRMRRNAESLLVLAGIDTGRRVRQPMPVSDVIRTASSEIELYDRVRLDLQVDPLMLGHNALNAAHLLAELLENATMFSEPHTPVEVSTAHDYRGVVVTVRDHGLGMTPEEIADANAKVASRSAQDAVGAQRLGLYVVGRLSDRLGAAIAFSTGPDGTGTMVTVVFPPALFVPDDAVPLPQPTDPLDAATQREAATLGQSIALGEIAPPAPAYADAAPAYADAAPVFADAAPLSAFGQVAQEALAAASAPLAEPEAPVAVPVDLDALTDGTTATGMPRRRTARPEPAAEADGPADVVLPPLETPDLPFDLTSSEAWTPPADVEASERALPSRQRAERAAEPQGISEPEPAPALAVEQRSALFSSFRSLNELDDTVTGSLHLEASVEDPAAVPEPLAPVPLAPAPSGAAPSPFSAVRTAAEPAQVAAAPQVPAFDALMADLPHRRTERDQHAATERKRGLFGRRPQDGSVTAAIPVQAADGAGALSFLAPAPVAPIPAAAPFPPAAAPAPLPFGAGQAPAPAPSALRPFAAPDAPAAPAPSPAPAPAYADPAPAFTDAPSTSRSANGGSALPLRSGASDELTDPLDPYAIPDTVEARSEWMASAVLYEEMSSLLRRGVFEEQPVTQKDDVAYRPLSTPSADSAGLVRRQSRPTVNPATDRFTARIERDPEQLRSRLSAFQSATTRGRSATEGDGPSTWAPTP